MGKFSVCVITRNEEKTLPRLLKSLEKFRDYDGKVCVLDTGSTDSTVQIAKDWGCIVRQAGDTFRHTISGDLAFDINYKFLRRDEPVIVKEGDSYFNFAAARNMCAELSPTDWVCWADADEEFTVFDVPEIGAILDDKSLAHLEYEFIFSHKPDGSPALAFRQSKFYDKTKIRWTNITHEILEPINGGGNVLYLPRELFLLEHWQQPGDRHSYLKGLAVDCFQRPQDDRNAHYLARELFWSGRYHSAIALFEEHIKMNKWPAERAQSYIFMGDCYGHLNNPDEQASCYFKAIHVDPNRREAYMKLANFYLFNKNYRAAVSFATAATTVPWDGYYASDKRDYEAAPHSVLYKAYGWLGDIANAQKHLLEALAFEPYNPEFLRDTVYYFEYPNHAEIEGWMRFPELQWLYNTAKKYKNICEIGSWKGKSAHCMLSAGANLTCVDTWWGSEDERDDTHWLAQKEDVFETFKKNVGHFPNLNIVRKTSVEAAKDFPDGFFDVVFVDAGHTKEEVKEDVLAWIPKVKNGGILAGHDYDRSTWMTVCEGVDEVFGAPDEIIDSIWVKYI